MTSAIDTVVNVFEKEERDKQLVKSAFLRANVWKYQATGGHGQNLVFANIWLVDGYYHLNKCDVVCFSKYRLNFEKKGRKSI